MNCPWCHNPEGKAREREFMWWEERCLHCRDCQNACTRDAISLADDYLTLDRKECDLCGACTTTCHSQALKLVGEEVMADQLANELRKDTIFYDESGGGVTFSGGEPLMQPVFLLELLRTCEEAGIHTAIDTCGHVNSNALLRISKHADLFLYDVKMISDEKHVKYTGVSNKLILKNLKKLTCEGRRVIVRFALIPGVNDDKEDIAELGRYVSSLEGVDEMNVLPYHKGGVEKQKRLQPRKELPFKSTLPSTAMLIETKRKLEIFGLRVTIGG